MANKLIGWHRIFYVYACTSFAIVFLILFLVGCVTTNTMVSSSIDRKEIRLGDYKNVFIYPSEKASFVELELEILFDAVGLKVIGRKGVVAMSEKFDFAALKLFQRLYLLFFFHVRQSL